MAAGIVEQLAKFSHQLADCGYFDGVGTLCPFKPGYRSLCGSRSLR